jgi:hypothetical protein
MFSLLLLLCFGFFASASPPLFGYSALPNRTASVMQEAKKANSCRKNSIFLFLK